MVSVPQEFHAARSLVIAVVNAADSHSFEVRPEFVTGLHFESKEQLWTTETLDLGSSNLT